jgi:Ca-activated chloride channel family protein
MKRSVLTGFLLALLSVAGTASQKVVSPQILSVETDLVTLSVTVADSRGALVTGLRAENFTVLDRDQPQMIEFFSNDDVPATVGLVIDSSGSMRGHREQIAAAASAFTAMSHPLDELFTVNFNDYVWSGLPATITFTSDRDRLRAALFAAPTEGMSALYDAVEHALDHLGLGTHDRRALIVVSDGGDNASSHSFDAVLEHARRSRAMVYSVSLFDPDDHDARPRVLKKLAAETGAMAFAPKDANRVARAFTRIARELRAGYTIGFVPSDSSPDGFRPVRVIADAHDGRKLTARTRAGYYVDP